MNEIEKLDVEHSYMPKILDKMNEIIETVNEIIKILNKENENGNR